MRRVSLVAVVLSTSALALVATPGLEGTAVAQPVGCGTTITQNTTLTADVGPCPGDGIIVGADHITLNLNGHTVSGIAAMGNDSVGIRFSMRNGSKVAGPGAVTGFDAGVAIRGGASNTVFGVNVHDNIGALDLNADFGDGVFIMNSSHNTVSNNHVAHNGPFEGIGVFGTAQTGNPTSVGNRIVGNTVEDNNIFVTVGAGTPFEGQTTADDGVNLGFGFDGGAATTVDNNIIRRNGLHGVSACSQGGGPCLTTDNIISRNTIDGNGLGPAEGHGINVVDIVHVPGTSFRQDNFEPVTRDVIVGNRVTNQQNGVGIFVATDDNRILNNVALNNNDPTFIPPLSDLVDLSGTSGPTYVPCDSNIWRGNTYDIGGAGPPCTTIGGHAVGSAMGPATAQTPHSAAESRANHRAAPASQRRTPPM